MEREEKRGEKGAEEGEEDEEEEEEEGEGEGDPQALYPPSALLMASAIGVGLAPSVSSRDHWGHTCTIWICISHVEAAPPNTSNLGTKREKGRTGKGRGQWS